MIEALAASPSGEDLEMLRDSIRTFYRKEVEPRVKEFEAGKGLRKTAHGHMVFLVGVTLLHELTHWADDQDGVDDPVPGDPTNEEGEEFERRVYGGIVN